MHCLTLSEALRTEQKYQPQGLCGKQVQQFSRGVRKQSRVFLSQWPWVLVWEDFVKFYWRKTISCGDHKGFRSDLSCSRDYHNPMLIEVVTSMNADAKERLGVGRLLSGQLWL